MRLAYSRISFALLAAFLLLPASVRAQSAANPVSAFGASGIDIAREIAVDAQGNLFVAGSFEGTVDFDPGSGEVSRTSTSQSGDSFLASYDANGAVRFVNALPGFNDEFINDIDIDAAGNVYIVGSFNANISLNPADPNQQLQAVRVRDGFVASYTSAGAFRFGFGIGTANFDEALSIAVTPTNGFYVTGFFEGIADFDPGAGTAELTSSARDLYVASYDANGGYRSAFRLPVVPSAIAVDLLGNVHITGIFTSTVDFDPGTGIAGQTAVGGESAFFATYTSALAYQNVFIVGSPTFDGRISPQDLATDAAGNLYATGTLLRSVDFDPGSGEVIVDNTNSVGNPFMASYTPAGALRYASLIEGNGNSIAPNIDVRADGTTTITGNFNRTLDFDPSDAGVQSREASSTLNGSTYVASYDANGAYRFVTTFTNSFGFAVASGPTGAIYSAGGFLEIADFDQSAGEELRSSNGFFDAFIVGLNADGSLLPVELTAFTATLDGASARLNWTTVSETNNAGFAVEHAGPGLAFADAGWVDGNGTTLEAHNYRFAVANLAAGTHRFRLRQTDLDGATELSPVVELSVGLSETSRLSLAPNPASDESRVSVQVQRAQTVRVSIFDALGREVAVLLDGAMGADEALSLAVDASALPAGLYMVRLTGETVRQTRTLIVAR